MKKTNRLFAPLFSVVLFLLFFSTPTQAVLMNSGDIVNLPKDKKISETAFIAGSDITIDADVDGDLFCAGRNITVNGNIKGDVICAGQLIKINGIVDGNVRTAAQTVEINGLVTRNVLSFSQSLTLAKFSSVKGDIFFGVQNVDLRGTLGRDIGGAAEQINISGSLLRNALVTASKIAIIDPAKVGGNFEYYMDNTGTASVNQKNIKGEIIKHEIVRKEIPQKEVKRVSQVGMAMGKIFWLITTLVLGFTLLYFLKSGVAGRIKAIADRPVITGLIGLAVLILTPLVFVLLLVTVIGVPVAFVLLLEYIVSLIIASVFPIILLGQWLIKSLAKKKSESLAWSLMAGTVAVWLLMFIPVIGGLTGFVLLCLGLGATFLSFLPEK